MSGSPYGECWYCGSKIARPITEMFWCNDGCKAAWGVEKAKVALELAVHAPKVPKPGFPVLGNEAAKMGMGGWGDKHWRRQG